MRRPEPVSLDEMRLPRDVHKAMEEYSRSWLLQAKQYAEQYEKIGLENVDLTREWAAVKAEAEQAGQLLDEGQASAAYWRAVNLGVRAEAAIRLGWLFSALRKGDFERARGVLSSVLEDVGKTYAQSLDLLRGSLPDSPSDLMTLMDAFEAMEALQPEDPTWDPNYPSKAP